MSVPPHLPPRYVLFYQFLSLIKVIMFLSLSGQLRLRSCKCQHLRLPQCRFVNNFAGIFSDERSHTCTTCSRSTQTSVTRCHLLPHQAVSVQSMSAHSLVSRPEGKRSVVPAAPQPTHKQPINGRLSNLCHSPQDVPSHLFSMTICVRLCASAQLVSQGPHGRQNKSCPPDMRGLRCVQAPPTFNSHACAASSLE